MKFILLFFLFSMLFSLNSFATIVPLEKPKLDNLNSVLVNEQSEIVEGEVAIIDEEQYQELSEDNLEKSAEYSDTAEKTFQEQDDL